VTQVGGTVGGVLPVGGGVVTETTGTVGGIVTGTTGTVTNTVDQALGGALGGGGLLPTDALDSLLGSLGIVYLNGPAGPAGAGGAGGAAGTTGPGGLVLDARSPNARFQVLSRLSLIATTGRIGVRVTVDEAGIVAFKGAVRPGKTRKLAKGKRALKAVSRKPIKFPSAVLAFRKAGSLRVTIQLSRQSQRRLGKVRDARMSLAVLTADVLRNQGKTTFKRVVKR
jgi:ribosomal protein S9